MKLNVIFEEANTSFSADFEETGDAFRVSFNEEQIVKEYVGGEPYKGDYDIIPKVEKQTMPTKEKVMLDDVTILAIPFFEVGNTSGGNTVYIAGEIELE